MVTSFTPFILFVLGFIISSSYTNGDPIGIELSGALKNVYAIAAGMSDGLGFQNNTRASWYHSISSATQR